MLKKLLFTSALYLASSYAMNAQTVLFQDNFDSYTDFAKTNVGNWTIRDLDLQNTWSIEMGDESNAISVNFSGVGLPMGFMVFNPTATSPALYSGTANGYEARSGSKYMVSIGAVSGDSNDWLISPRISLGSAGNQVSFYAKSLTTNYNGGERFEVYVSTTDTQVSSFTKISGTNYIIPPVTWTNYTYDLANFNNQQVYIAIRCVSNDEFIFMVDDFSVTTTGTTSTQDFEKLGLSMYPNPVSNVLNIVAANGNDIQNIMVTDINGRTVKQATTSQVNVSDLAQGTYLVKVTTTQGVATSKFIKK